MSQTYCTDATVRKVSGNTFDEEFVELDLGTAEGMRSTVRLEPAIAKALAVRLASILGLTLSSPTDEPTIHEKEWAQAMLKTMVSNTQTIATAGLLITEAINPARGRGQASEMRTMLEGILLKIQGDTNGY